MTPNLSALSIADVLEALAVRCEAATTGDRELDCRIWCAVCPTGAYTIDDWMANKPRPAHVDVVGLALPDWLEKWPEQTDAMADSYGVLRYTDSLDAAMSLVPEGWRTAMVSEMEHRDGWHWRLGRKHSSQIRFGEGGIDGVAATAALALCSAALRARASLAREQSA